MNSGTSRSSSTRSGSLSTPADRRAAGDDRAGTDAGLQRPRSCERAGSTLSICESSRRVHPLHVTQQSLRVRRSELPSSRTCSASSAPSVRTLLDTASLAHQLARLLVGLRARLQRRVRGLTGRSRRRSPAPARRSPAPRTGRLVLDLLGLHADAVGLGLGSREVSAPPAGLVVRGPDISAASSSAALTRLSAARQPRRYGLESALLRFGTQLLRGLLGGSEDRRDLLGD